MKRLLPALLLCISMPTGRVEAKPPPRTLEQYQVMYERNRRNIASEYSARTRKAFADYKVLLHRAKTMAQREGNFEDTSAAMAELKRFAKEQTIPEATTEDTAGGVAQAQQQYHQALQEARDLKLKKMEDLTERYTRMLKGMLSKLLTRNRMAEAEKINKEIKRVKAALEEMKPAKTRKATDLPAAQPKTSAAAVR